MSSYLKDNTSVKNIRTGSSSSTSTKSVLRCLAVLTPMRRGDPRRAATISLGKCRLLKMRANAPSYYRIGSIYEKKHVSIIGSATTYQLLANGLDEPNKSHGLPTHLLLIIIHEFTQLCCGLGIRVRLKDMPILFKNGSQFLVIGNDSIVDDNEFVSRV